MLYLIAMATKLFIIAKYYECYYFSSELIQEYLRKVSNEILVNNL